jgi:hypothetical protein
MRNDVMIIKQCLGSRYEETAVVCFKLQIFPYRHLEMNIKPIFTSYPPSHMQTCVKISKLTFPLILKLFVISLVHYMSMTEVQKVSTATSGTPDDYNIGRNV